MNLNNLDLAKLQKHYDAMVELAKASNYDLTPSFEMELFKLAQAIKALGGKL